MPVRAPTRVRTEGGGFGGFAPNPNFRMADGRRVLTSDIEQAQNTMHFGTGVTSAPRTTPSPSPAPSFNEWTTAPNDRRFLPSPSPTEQPSRPSRGNIHEPQPPFQIDQSRWNGNLFSSNPYDPAYIPAVVGDIPGSLDTRFVGGLETSNTITSGGGRSPSFVTDPNDDWMGSDEQPEGLPRAIAPRDSGLWHGPDRPQISSDELYADETAIASSGGKPPSFIDDPNQDWIGSAPPSIGQHSGAMAGFGGNMTIGQFLNTPLAFMRFGEGRGYQPPMERVRSGTVSYADRSYTTPGESPVDPVTGWSPSPQEAANSEATLAAAEEQGRRETPQGEQTPAPASDPASRYGNLSSPTGQNVYFDGRNWRPVSSAPSDIRWDPNNPHNSNFTASETTKAYLSGGQQPGNPNNTASFATEGRFLTDEENNPTMQGRMYGDRRGEFRIGQKGEAPTRYGDAVSQLAHNNWLRQQPEYKAWMKSRGG